MRYPAHANLPIRQGTIDEGAGMFDHSAEAERLVCCFDPDASLVQGATEHLVISPRWGRLRRDHPLLAAAPHEHGPGHAWQKARENLLTCRDRSVQLAIVTYEHRVRVTARVSLEVLMNPRFDLHAHCHAELDRGGAEKKAVPMRRETFWIQDAAAGSRGLRAIRVWQHVFGADQRIGDCSGIAHAALKSFARLLGP